MEVGTAYVRAILRHWGSRNRQRHMRIAFVSFDFGEYSIRHANALAERADVLLLLPEALAGDRASQVANNVHYEPFQKPRLRQPVRQWKTTRRVLRIIREFKPDVVHFQGGHLWFNFALPQLAREYPLTMTVHNPRHHIGDRDSRRTPQWVLDFGYRRAGQIIVHGEKLKNELELSIGADPRRVHVIPHIVMGDPEMSEESYDDGNTLLFFGRIWEYKGLEYLIRAQPLVTNRLPDTRFVIAGEGEDFARYRAMMTDASKFSVHNRRVSDEERAKLFNESSIVVLPYIGATQSGVVPVAYNHGKPVIATEVGGLPEVVDHGRTGLLVPPKDERALADAIVKLLVDHKLRQAMGVAAREKIQSECGPEVVANAHLRVYQYCIEDRTNSNVASGKTTNSPTPAACR